MTKNESQGWSNWYQDSEVSSVDHHISFLVFNFSMNVIKLILSSSIRCSNLCHIRWQVQHLMLKSLLYKMASVVSNAQIFVIKDSRCSTQCSNLCHIRWQVQHPMLKSLPFYIAGQPGSWKASCIYTDPYITHINQQMTNHRMYSNQAKCIDS